LNTRDSEFKKYLDCNDLKGLTGLKTRYLGFEKHLDCNDFKGLI
jgi:hypothetical protein